MVAPTDLSDALIKAVPSMEDAIRANGISRRSNIRKGEIFDRAGKPVKITTIPDRTKGPGFTKGRSKKARSTGVTEKPREELPANKSIQKDVIPAIINGRRIEVPIRPAETLDTSRLIEITQNHLYLQREERLSQARMAFRIALAALTLGILLVFTGVLFIFIINLPVGTATAISSIVVDIISALAFKFSMEANDRLDSITKELSILDRTSLAMHYISYISVPEKKDEAIIDLIKQLYALAPNRDNIKNN